MEVFRSRNVKSVVYGGLIIVTVVVFIFGFGPSRGQKGMASIREECVSVVHGHCISLRDFKSAEVFFARRASEPQQTASESFKRLVLDGLIERELLAADAERLDLTVTENELNDQLLQGIVHLSLPTDKPSLAFTYHIQDGRVLEDFRDPKTKKFDMKTYERNVRRFAGSPVEFREAQARELLAAKMRDLIRAPVRVSEVEALEAYIAEKSSATLTHVDVPQKFAARYAIAVTDADVDKWAADEANKKLIDSTVTSRKESALPKAGQIRHILVKVDPSATTEGKALALGRLSEAAARVKRGEPFGEVARDMSEDPGSATRGGAYSDDMLDKFVEPFKWAAKALKPGETTPGAVETQFGFHLITRDDPSPAKIAEVEAALPKAVARELYTKEKSLEAAKALADKIYASMKAGTPAGDAVKAAMATLKNPQGPANVTPLTILPPASETSAASAASDAGTARDAGADAQEAGVGTTTTTSADAGVVSSEAPAYVAKFATAETDPDRPEATTTTSFNRGGDPIPSISGEAASKVLQFAFSAKPGELYPEVVRGEQGFVVIALKERKPATKDEFDKDRDTYLQTLLAAKQNEALALYVKRLRDASKSEIKINESYLRSPNRPDGGAANPFEDEEP
jgi:peptidyl-prolyl cis-trans isomerase D